MPLALDGGQSGVDGGGPFPDAGPPDAGTGELDAGAAEDGGVPDGGTGDPDAGALQDGGVPGDGGSDVDAGVTDAGSVPDGGAEPDGGQAVDAGTVQDGGAALPDGGAPPLPGDLCSMAEELVLDPQTGKANVEGSLSGMGSEVGLCGGAGPDRYYAVSARGSVSTTALALDGGAVQAAVLAACPAGAVTACNPSLNASQPATARYVVAVTSTGADADAFSLEVSGQAPAAGDACGAPLFLAPLTAVGRSSNLNANFSGITQGHTERDNPCSGMFPGASRRDMVFAVEVKAAGDLRVEVDPTSSTFVVMPDVGVGLTSGSTCSAALPAGVCVNAVGAGGVEQPPDLPVPGPGLYFIWVSAASVSSGSSVRVSVTARLK